MLALVSITTVLSLCYVHRKAYFEKYVNEYVNAQRSGALYICCYSKEPVGRQNILQDALTDVF